MRPLTRIAVLVLLPIVGDAADAVGSWLVQHDKSDGYYAVTMNDSGSILGQFCFPESGNCVWLLGLDTRCEEGYRSPILANADTGSASLEVYCNGKLEAGLYRYAFTDFEAVDEIVRNGRRVGFALPLEGDRFAVERFNLDGSVRAIDEMRREAETGSAGPTGTKREIM